MSFNFHPQKKSQNKPNAKYFLSSNKNNSNNNNNKFQKRAVSQKRFLPSEIITQIPSSNLYLNNIYSNNSNNLNYLHQQAFTPINRRKKLYEDDFLIPVKFPQFKNKKTLVLDLDETLVHSSFFPFEKNDVILNVNLEGVYYNIYVLIRPWVEKFIQEMGKYFEIIIFTASIAAYASPLLDILDKGKNIQYRLYREQCNFVNGVFIKDLKRLNRSLKDIIIIDNSPLAYAFDVDNGLPILSWFDNRDDKELLLLEPILKFLGKVDDVRKYIKKFLRNNCINYEIANRIMKDYEEAEQAKKNKKEGTNNESNLKSSDFEEEKGESKGECKNNIENNTSTKIKNANKGKNMKTNNINLLNNFIIKNDMNNIPKLINDDIKNNNINNIMKLDNKINNLKNEKKSIKLKLQSNNNNLVKSFDIDKRNNNMKPNKNNRNKNNEKKNLFRFGFNNDKKTTNNIAPISSHLKPHLKLQNLKESNFENDIKINDNVVMPRIYPLGSNTTKNGKLQLNNNNSNKNIMKQKNNFLKVSNSNNIEPLSSKKAFNYNPNPASQFKYLNLLEKFEEGNTKSSSLKAINDPKNEMKINNMRRSAKYKMNNSTNNSKNKMNLKNRLKLSSKLINDLNNQNLELNINSNKNKITDMYSHVLRSKSTGNFVKLKSAHPRTPKTINKMMNSDLKWINNEDNKINNFKK